MKEQKKTSLKPIDIVEPTFDTLKWVNEELVEKGIYAVLSTKSVSVTWTGTFKVECGFPPRLIQAIVQEADQFSQWSSDFSFTFSIRWYNWGIGGFLTSQSSTNLISMSNLIAVPTTRVFDGFNINVTTFSGGAKTVFFTCYS